MGPSVSQIQSELAQAEQHVKDGAVRLEEQRERMTRVSGPNSRKFLRLLEETQKLYEGHLALLQRELAEAGRRPPRLTTPEPSAASNV